MRNPLFGCKCTRAVGFLFRRDSPSRFDLRLGVTRSLPRIFQASQQKFGRFQPLFRSTAVAAYLCTPFYGVGDSRARRQATGAGEYLDHATLSQNAGACETSLIYSVRNNLLQKMPVRQLLRNGPVARNKGVKDAGICRHRSPMGRRGQRKDH